MRTMFTTYFCLLFIGLIRADSIVQRPGVDDDCAKFCDATYADKPDQLESCKQGCRLFSIIQLTGERDNVDGIRSECTKSCGEAYSENAGSGQACSQACQKQTPKTGNIEIHLDGNSPFKDRLTDMADNIMPHLNGFFNEAMSLINSMRDKLPSGDDMHGMVNNMKTMMNWDEFFGPEKSIDIPKVADPQTDEAGPKVLNEDAKHLGLESFGDSSPVGNSDEDGRPMVVVHMVPLDGFLHSKWTAEDSSAVKELTPHEPSPPVGVYVDDDWLACMGRRVRRLSYITRWMLFMALMLSVISMIWICLAILRTTPRRRFGNLSPGAKGGLDNVYYTTPPFTASDKTPMIITTSDYKAQPLAESPPPPYHATNEEKKEKDQA